VLLTDTTPEAHAVQTDVYCSMSGEQRLLVAFEMSMFARDLSRERIRHEHPDWSAAQVSHELLKLAFFPASLPDLR